MSRASTRISIRWPPAPASEPTDTLVLSLGGYYVDLRVRKCDKTIDWLLVGERIVVSEDPVKVKFTHILDSQHSPGAPLPEADIGDFEKLPNGDDLETGVMPNHDAGGQPMAYEEVWRELHAVSSGNLDSVNWIIESVDATSDQAKVFCAKIGPHFLAVRKTAQSGNYSALRQELDLEQQEWKVRYDIGSKNRGSGLHQLTGDALEEDRWKVGGEIAFGDAKYVVRACHAI